MTSPPRDKIHRFRKALLSWAHAHGREFPWREPGRSDYECVIAEVLLQRTQATTVAKFYEGFISQYPGWKALASAQLEELEEALKPIGLWKQRANSTSRLAKAIMKGGGEIPTSREEIDDLPGVGQYIANAIELICQGANRPLVDVNMARVLERYFGPRKLADIRYDPYLQKLAHDVIDCKTPVELNFAILDFAATVCRARTPRCSECPLAKDCLFLNSRQGTE